MRWSIDADPLMVLHAKLWLVQSPYLTRQLHHNGEDIVQEKIHVMIVYRIS